jgi:uncharacterized protein with PIN domain
VIVVDTSAVIAILNREAGFENLLLKLLKDTERRISPVASLELVMVLSRNHDNPATEANAYLRQENIALYPIDSTLTEWERASALCRRRFRQDRYSRSLKETHRIDIHRHTNGVRNFHRR